MVQQETLSRRGKGTRHPNVKLFSSRIKCADCGGWYGSKRGNATIRLGTKTPNPHFTQADRTRQFVKAVNQLLATNKVELIGNLETM